MRSTAWHIVIALLIGLFFATGHIIWPSFLSIFLLFMILTDETT